MALDIHTLRKGDKITVFATVVYDVAPDDQRVHIQIGYSTATAEPKNCDQLVSLGFKVGDRACL